MMSMIATHPSGPHDCPRKQSAMIVQGLLSGVIVCLVLIALVIGLHFGTPGHAAPSGHTGGRWHGPLAPQG